MGAPWNLRGSAAIHPSIHPFIHISNSLFIQPSIIHLFILPLIHAPMVQLSCIHSFNHPSIHLSLHPSIHPSFIHHSFINPFVLPLIHPPIHSSIHSGMSRTACGATSGRSMEPARLSFHPWTQEPLQIHCVLSSDVDPDPVGFVFIWVRGSGSRFRTRIRTQRYKMKGRAEVSHQIFCFFFVGNFSKSEPKKVANF